MFIFFSQNCHASFLESRWFFALLVVIFRKKWERCTNGQEPSNNFPHQYVVHKVMWLPSFVLFLLVANQILVVVLRQLDDIAHRLLFLNELFNMIIVFWLVGRISEAVFLEQEGRHVFNLFVLCHSDLFLLSPVRIVEDWHGDCCPTLHLIRFLCQIYLVKLVKNYRLKV